MAEYSREQRNQLSRAVANSDAGSRQLKGFVDNRVESTGQLKSLYAFFNMSDSTVTQMVKIKMVTGDIPSTFAYMHTKAIIHTYAKGTTSFPLDDRIYNFVVIDNEILISAISGHPVIAAGKDVDYAGEISIKGTQVKWWSNGSGHYKPDASLNGQAGLPLNLFISYDQTETLAHKVVIGDSQPVVIPKGKPIAGSDYSQPLLPQHKKCSI